MNKKKKKGQCTTLNLFDCRLATTSSQQVSARPKEGLQITSRFTDGNTYSIHSTIKVMLLLQMGNCIYEFFQVLLIDSYLKWNHET